MLNQDLRYAFRWLRANPGFTVAAIVVLALGIGATTATFTVVHSVALRPLPFATPEGLVRVWTNRPESNLPYFSVSLEEFTEWRSRSRTLTNFAAYNAQRPMVVRVGAENDVVVGSYVTAEIFPLLGVNPSLGRWLSADESRPGGPAVAVIGHGFWQRRFGGRADVLGQALVLDDQSHTIVGVMPNGFAIPNNPSELWLPLQAPLEVPARGNRYLRVLGRLRPGASVDDARTEMDGIAAELAVENPATNRGWGVSIRPMLDTVVSPEFRQGLFVLLGAVAIVLLVACTNVAGLLLSRVSVRRREMAVRTALGAPRSALIRQMLIESLVLASAGGLAGVLVAMWSIDGLARLAANTIPRLDEIVLRPPVIAAALGLTAATVILFGLVPALNASRGTLASLRSREGSDHRGGSRGRDVLVLAEIALAVVLLVGAGLLTRSFLELQARNLGFDSDRLLVVQLAFPDGPAAAARRAATYDELISRVQAIPDVERAAAALGTPFGGRNPGNSFTIPGRPAEPGLLPNADYRVVTPGYLRTMRIPLLRGRDLTEADGEQVPVTVISQSMASQYWPDTDPVGTQIQWRNTTMTIVGVAADARYIGIDAPTDALRPMMYLPHRFAPVTPMDLVVRTRGSEESAIAAIRGAVRAVAPEMPISRVTSMDETLAEARGPQRFNATVLGAFAWIALVLAAAGLWGLIAYGVARRTREIGIRVALGARPGEVLRMTAGRGIALALAGIALGLAGAAGATSVLERLLFGITATDPTTFAAIAVVFLAVAALASVLPARRALRIDPAEALRAE